MLKYTGHPIIDVGAATIAAFANKRRLEDVAEADLQPIADYICERYVVNPLKSFLNVAYLNSGYTQPAFEKQPHKRIEYAKRVTSGRKLDQPTSNEICVFTGLPAIGIALNDKDGFPIGRAFRQHIPMVTGEDVINFHPGGDAGVPVSGLAMLCIQAFPLGCAKCGGKLLAVHSDNPVLTLRFARKFLQNNLKQVDLAIAAGSSKLPEAGSAKTTLITTFIEIEQDRIDQREDGRPCSVTAYHMSNSGQSNPLDRNPPLEIYHLPLELIVFLSMVQQPMYKTAWNAISQRGWQTSKPKKQKKGETAAIAALTTSEEDGPKRNYLYEDLFRLPQDAALFIRRYFLRMPVRNAAEDDPRRGYSLKRDAELVSWTLTQLFLEKVMRMNPNRITQIKTLADGLAQYIHDENDEPFFRNFYTAQKYGYGYLRNLLIRLDFNRLKKNQPPLNKFEPFLEVFGETDSQGWTQWKLAHDLVLIRMIERLFELRWIQEHPEALPDDLPEMSEEQKKAD